MRVLLFLIKIFLILIFVITSAAFADESTDYKALDENSEAKIFIKFLEKYPEGKYFENAKYKFFKAFPKLLCFQITIGYDLTESLKTTLIEILKNKGYTNLTFNSSAFPRPYYLEVSIEYRTKLLSGNFPAADIPVLHLKFSKYDNDKKNSKSVLINESIQADLPDCLIAYSYREIQALKLILQKSLLEKVKDIDFPTAEPISLPMPPEPANDNDDNISNTKTDDDDDEHKLHPETEPKIGNPFEQHNGIEFKISLGLSFTNTTSDDGISEGTADPLTLGFSFNATLYDLSISDIIIPKITINASIISEADEEWTFKTDKLGGSIINFNLFAEFDCQGLLGEHKNIGILKLGDAELYIYAGVGILADLISLTRTNVEIGGIPQPDESVDSFLFGFGWYFSARLRGLFTPKLYLNIKFLNNFIFAEKLSGGYVLTLSVGYNLSEEMSISLTAGLGSNEYAFSNLENFFSDYFGISLRLSLIL